MTFDGIRNRKKRPGERTHGIAPPVQTVDRVLSPGQQLGVDFISSRKVSYLGDKMGAGKTLQICKSLLTRPAAPVIVVCPAVACGVWKREILANCESRWVPRVLDAKWLEPVNPAKGLGVRGEFKPSSPTGCSIISYNLLARHTDRILSRLTSVHRGPGAPAQPPHLVFDEAHALANPNSDQTQAAYRLAQISQSIVFASGTPEPNGYPSELWVAMTWAGLTDLSYDAFIERYCTFYEMKLPGMPSGGENKTYRPPQMVRKITGARHDRADEFKALKAKFLIEREAEHVAPVNMPIPTLRVPEIIEVDPDPDLALDILFPLEFNSGMLDPILEEQRAAVRGITGAARRFVQGTQAAAEADIPPLVAISESVSTFRKYTGALKARGAARHIIEGFLGGEMSKCVVFAWHTEVLNLLEKYLRGIPMRRITGSQTPAQRTAAEEWFQSTVGYAIILGQIKAAGVAITLTEANIVYLVEQSYVPGHNAQAIKRVHRIGQTRACVARMVELKGDPIEQHVTRLLARKTDDMIRLSLQQPDKPDVENFPFLPVR